VRHLKCVAAINARHQAEKKRLQMAMAPADHVPPARTSTPGRLYVTLQLICSDAAASDAELHMLWQSMCHILRCKAACCTFKLAPWSLHV